MPSQQESTQDTLDAALTAVRVGAWTDALRLAGSMLVQDPLNAGALDVISTARRALESTREGGAERRQLTILFADVADSTTLLNQLGAERYRDFILDVHEAAAKSVSGFGGRIGQYLGDGILAYFSYPQAYEDDAQRAVYAGLDLIARIERASSTWTRRFGASLALRIGADTGRVVIGAAGAGQWTTLDAVFGEPAHLAARLQALAPRNSMVISESTQRLVAHQFALESLGPQQFAGYPGPQFAYRVTGANDGPRSVASGRSMIDREREAATLEGLWASTRSGRREDIVIVGEAGVGKSSLVEHIANIAMATAGRVVILRCARVFRNTPFYPVAGALRRLLGVPEKRCARRDVLRTSMSEAGIPDDLADRALAPLAFALDLHDSADLLPQQVRTALFDVLVELVSRLATAAPLLIVIEDLHLADPSTSELLAHLRSRATGAWLMVATVRTDDGQSQWSQKLQIEPLPSEFARALVHRTVPDLSESAVKSVVTACGGIPLFLVDSARSLAFGGMPHALPSPTTALVNRRLTELDVDARSIVSDLAVAGIATPCSLLSAISELSADRFERGLARLVHDGLLVSQSRDSESSVVQFRHLLYQEVLYDVQLEASRQRRHARCADAMIRFDLAASGSPPELIARHLTMGRRPAEAIAWWRQAGERAAAAAAHAEAASHFSSALAALESSEGYPEDAGIELCLRLSYGASCSSIHGYTHPKVMEAYSRAAELGAASADTAMLLPALWGLWAYYVVRGSHEQALELSMRCVAVAEASGLADARAISAGIRGAQYAYLGRWPEALAELRKTNLASGHLAQLFPQDQTLAGIVLLAVAEWVTGNDEPGRVTLETAIDRANALTGRQAEFTRAYVYCYAAWFAQLADDHDRALSRAQRVVDIAQRHGFETWLGAGTLHLAAALAETGAVPRALGLFAQALDGWRAAGAALFLPYFLGRYGRALHLAGRYAVAATTLREAIDLAESTGELFYLAELRRLLADSLRAKNAPIDEVLEQLEGACRNASVQGAVAFESRSRRIMSQTVESTSARM
jgi:class 3 adenylate cyclase/predicted ATPase